jgi:hypothetical protein
LLKSGDCLLIETNFDEWGFIQNHLFIIILEPQGTTRNTIIVNIDKLTSRKQDQTTILNPGDHDFIDVQSYVNYGRAKIRSFDELEDRVRKGDVKLYPPLKDDIFQRVCEGILKSKFTSYEVRELYLDNLF